MPAPRPGLLNEHHADSRPRVVTADIEQALLEVCGDVDAVARSEGLSPLVHDGADVAARVMG